MKIFIQFVILSLGLVACGQTSEQLTVTASIADTQTLAAGLTPTLPHSPSPTDTPKPTSTVTPSPTSTATPSQTPTPEPVTIEGLVTDCRYPYGALVGIPNATVQLEKTTTTTDDQGQFSIVVPYEDRDALLEISAEGYVPYRERPSRMVEGAFHLIPEDLYRGVYLVLWNPEIPNPQNWHRKWETQTEFVVVRSGASEAQINTLLRVLATDRYSDMTGSLFTSSLPPTIVDVKPAGSDRRGKTVISFEPNIIPGGIAHSEDENGVIYYAEITWSVDQFMDANIIWHEMVHTVTAGGHINEWPSVVSEVQSLGGDLSPTDIEIFNCIYNSPPKRAKPAKQP